MDHHHTQIIDIHVKTKQLCECGFHSCTPSTTRIQRLHRPYLAYSPMGFHCWLYRQTCCYYRKRCQCCTNNPCISRTSQTSLQLSTYTHLVQIEKSILVLELYEVHFPLCSTCGTFVSFDDFPSCKSWSMIFLGGEGTRSLIRYVS